jgi:predicted dehydrogenase
MARIRIGVIGCGQIAQIMHLPHLRELHERFELAAVCDVSPGVLRHVGELHGVGARFADYRELLAAPLDAVLVASPDSHGQVVVDALRAGKHVLSEKPLCYTLREADEVIAARRAAGTVCMVAYMKRFDPAVRHALPRIRAMRDLQAIHVTILHPPEAAQTAHHDVRRFADVPEAARRRLRADQDRLMREAVGDFTAAERFLFTDSLISTLVHDVNLLRGLSGDPEDVLFTDAWAEAQSLVSVLRFPAGVRAVLALHFLRDLDRYEERVAYYAPAERISLVFPSPFFRNVPTELVLEGTADGYPYRTSVTASMREAFKEELLHFADCVETGRIPLTTPEEAREDVSLLHRMFRALPRPVGGGRS